VKFSGHETFVIRDGWFPKGLELLATDTDLFSTKEAADELGVGTNMIKSIRHWLHVCGFANKELTTKDGKRQSEYSISELGELVLKHDPCFVHDFTWWIAHINLCSETQNAYAFYWFYNLFPKRHFERALCQVSLAKHTANESFRTPTEKTLQKDVNVLLSCYSTVVPTEQLDPEDGSDCPLRSLGLVRFFKDSGQYKLNYGLKNIPPEAFAYALNKLSLEKEDEICRVSFDDISLKPGSPGRLFCLDAEGMYETALECEKSFMDDDFRIAGMAGSRQIILRGDSEHYWLEHYFERQMKAEALVETEVQASIC